MNILVQIREGEVNSIYVEPDDSILSLKTKIETLQNIPVAQQLLVFAGNPMVNDDMSLKDYNIVQYSMIFLVLKLRGACNGPICTCNKENDPQ